MMNWRRLAGTLKVLSETLKMVGRLILVVIEVCLLFPFIYYRCSRGSVDEVLAQSCE